MLDSHLSVPVNATEMEEIKGQEGDRMTDRQKAEVAWGPKTEGG